MKWYCPVEDLLPDILASGEWRSVFPIYGKVFGYLFFECRWSPETVSDLLEQLLKYIAMGMTEQEYFDWISDSFKENGIHLTKRMRKLFQELRNDFPSAALKGYTWGEYEKHRKDVTGAFSEDRRHYKDTYLEIDEVYNEEVEVSLFSAQEGPYEIYISYGRMYGIIYVKADEADAKREEVKKELAQEYEKHKEPTREFINSFCEKHQVSLPNDIFFNTTDLFGF